MKLFADIKVRLPRSFDKFAHSDATGGIIMLCCIVLALILQNGSYSTSYRHWLDTTAGVVFGDFILMKPLLLWINDGLITVFFFSIGLQLKIEFVEGHLSNPSNIVLPSLAAIAGILLPAFIFFAFNFDDAYAMRGWAIPTSHDTAFSVALLMVLGKRVPNSLKILLLSISVFDDLGSMFIVAVFYNNGLDVYALIPALAAVVAMIILNFFGVGRKSLYIALGVILWFSILKSGVHATSAGIITAFCMPMRSRTGEQVVHEVSDNLALWVSLVILPLFTLANAGVDLGDINISTIFSSVSMGIFLGLVIGKPMGMFSIMYVASRLKLVKLPNDITMIQVYGMCTLTGIGFSMSMFYDSLAYEGSNIYGYADALAILIAALVSGIYGFCFLRFVACKTPMIEYRPWLPAPTGYHGTARTANLYSLEKPVQGPSSVAPTAALVAEANKRNAAAAAAAEAAKKAAEAASKAAEIIKKAAEINDANKEKTIAEVQLAAAEAAQAAATVAVTATKLDDSEEHAETAENVETVLKTASQVAEEAKETVAEVTAESAESDADSTDADASDSASDNKGKAKAKTDDAKAAIDDVAATSIDETGAASAADDTAEFSTASDAVAKIKSKQADAEPAAAVESESSAAKSSKKSDKEIEVVETVIAVNSSGQAKVEKTVVKTTVEELKSKQQAAINEDSPLNAADYVADKAATAASQDAAVQTDASDETEASASSKKAASADIDAKSIAGEDSKADTEVDPLAEAIAKADKKAKELDEEHEEDILADLKPVKKPKSKTKYELGEEDDDSTYETIAEHKEVAHQTAKAVVDYLSRIAGKAKVEVSGNIERSDEEKAAARAAAAAKIAAIKAAELESQAQADAAVAEAKAKAAAEAAHKTVEKVEKEAAVKVSAKASEKQSNKTDDKQVETTSDKLSESSAVPATESKSDTDVAPKTAGETAAKETGAEPSLSADKTEDKSKSLFDPAVLVSGMVASDKDSDAEESKAKDVQTEDNSSKSKAATEELKAEVAREIKLADGETISEEVLESSSDEALAAIAAAESEAAKAEAEAEAAKAKAQEAKEAVAKAAEAARVAAEIAAAKKSEGKLKAKAQHAMEEAQKKASDSEDTEHDAKSKDKEETDTLSEVTTTVVDAVSTVASVVAVPAVKAAKIVSATASITASVTAAAVKAAAKVVESKEKDKEKDEHSKDGDTLVKEIITAKDPRFTKQSTAEDSQSSAHSDAQSQTTKQSAKDAESSAAPTTESAPASAPAAPTSTEAKPASDKSDAMASAVAADSEQEAADAKPSKAAEVEPLTVAEIASAASADGAGKNAQPDEAEQQPSASDEVDTENLTVKASAVKRKASEQPLEDIDALTLEEVTFKPVGPAPDLEPITSSDPDSADSASPADTDSAKQISAADDVDTENLTVKESVVKSKASAKAVEVDALTVDEVVTAVASGKELDESGYTQKAARLDDPLPRTDISVDESDRCDVQPIAKSDNAKSGADAASIEPLMADDYKHANKDYSEPNSVQFNDAEVKDDQGSVKSVVGKLADIIRKSKD